MDTMTATATRASRNAVAYAPPRSKLRYFS